VSVQSDLYSLGLILYEMFTGRPTHEAKSLADLVEHHRNGSVSLPTDLVAEMDPAVERVILRCLERDPAMRPGGVAIVAAGLPGGDPLAAALAAGETPTPEMVAAAGAETGLEPLAARLALIGVVVALVVAGVLAQKTLLINQASYDLPPQVLKDRAERLLEHLGYADAPVDSAYDFEHDPADWIEIRRADAAVAELSGAERQARLRDGTWPVGRFWYRRSPEHLVANHFGDQQFDLSWGRVRLNAPAWNLPGEAGVRLDPQGRLRWFRRIPTPSDDPVTGAAPWGDWFDEERLGFRLDDLTPTEPPMPPPDMADAVMAWRGAWPDNGEPLRVIAAAYRGRPTYFEVLHEDEPHGAFAGSSRFVRGAELAYGLLLFVQIVSVVMGWRNLRRGRCDRRGAFRFAMATLLMSALVWLLLSNHVLDVQEKRLWDLGLAQAVYLAGLYWLYYIALEPYTRRLWPQTLITWTRLLGGRFRDPLVGRDLLLGALAGCMGFICLELNVLAPAWLGLEAPPLIVSPPEVLRGSASLVGHAISQTLFVIFVGLVHLLLMLVLNLTLRNRWLGGAAYVIVITGLLGLLREGAPQVAWAPLGVFVVLIFVLMTRLGLLAVFAMLLTSKLLETTPLGADLGVWYAPNGLFMLGLIVAMVVYGYNTSLGGRGASAAAEAISRSGSV
jgi:serine/threonine-protein kinase